jgi:hypothetical protein
VIRLIKKYVFQSIYSMNMRDKFKCHPVNLAYITNRWNKFFIEQLSCRVIHSNTMIHILNPLLYTSWKKTSMFGHIMEWWSIAHEINLFLSASRPEFETKTKTCLDFWLLSIPIPRHVLINTFTETNTKTCLDLYSISRPIPRLVLIFISIQDQYQESCFYSIYFNTNTNWKNFGTLKLEKVISWWIHSSCWPYSIGKACVIKNCWWGLPNYPPVVFQIITFVGFLKVWKGETEPKNHTTWYKAQVAGTTLPSFQTNSPAVHTTYKSILLELTH